MRRAAASWLRRGAACCAILIMVGAAAQAQAPLAGPSVLDSDEMIGTPPMEEEMPRVEIRPGGASCSTISNRAMEASFVIAQHVNALAAGITPETRAQGLVLLAYLDQWAGRLRGLVDLGEFTECLDDGEAETYRRALVMANRMGNWAREQVYRSLRAPQSDPQRNRRP